MASSNSQSVQLARGTTETHHKNQFGGRNPALFLSTWLFQSCMVEKKIFVYLGLHCWCRFAYAQLRKCTLGDLWETGRTVVFWARGNRSSSWWGHSCPVQTHTNSYMVKWSWKVTHIHWLCRSFVMIWCGKVAKDVWYFHSIFICGICYLAIFKIRSTEKSIKMATIAIVSIAIEQTFYIIDQIQLI